MPADRSRRLHGAPPPAPPERAASDDLVVDARHAIPRSELAARATRAGGAGGQHVNTSSTRVELLWAPATSVALDEAERARVIARLARRLDAHGRVRVVASDTRSQRQNRELAEQRLAELVRRALAVPTARKRTRPTRASVERRLEGKRRSSEKKRGRGRTDWE